LIAANTLNEKDDLYNSTYERTDCKSTRAGGINYKLRITRWITL